MSDGDVVRCSQVSPQYRSLEPSVELDHLVEQQRA